MNTLNTIQELARAIRNLIRSGVVTEVDTVQGLCRVQSGGIQTTWLKLADHPRRSFADVVGSLGR